MINVLAIGLDHLMLQKIKFRGDVNERQFEYSKLVNTFHHIIYSPERLKFSNIKQGDNRYLYPTGSIRKAQFYFDAINIAERILKNNEIDLITTEDPFVTGLIGYRLKKKFKLPLNVQVHVDFCDNPFWIQDELENRLFNILGKWILKRADSIRVGTTYEKQKIVKLGVEEDRVKVIAVHSSFEKFSDADGKTRRKRTLGNEFDHLLFTAARITRQKDLVTMINAFEIVSHSIPRVLLVIAGDGPERKRIEALAYSKGLQNNIIFVGAVAHNMIPEYYLACDIFLLSSIFEGTCITIAEAASAGRPVVVSKIAGSYDLVRHGKTGFVFDIGDHESMANYIITLLNERDKACIFGADAQKIVRGQFSYEQNIKGLVEFWEKTANMLIGKK